MGSATFRGAAPRWRLAGPAAASAAAGPGEQPLRAPPSAPARAARCAAAASRGRGHAGTDWPGAPMPRPPAGSPWGSSGSALLEGSAAASSRPMCPAGFAARAAGAASTHVASRAVSAARSPARRAAR
eukprot:12587757-Alexandrium_andersonii.AAC.1